MEPSVDTEELEVIAQEIETLKDMIDQKKTDIQIPSNSDFNSQNLNITILVNFKFSPLEFKTVYPRLTNFFPTPA
jgi:hypothetical protein